MRETVKQCNNLTIQQFNIPLYCGKIIIFASSMEFYSHGKIMLSGEYAVLYGATCFALPTKLGQKMQVTFTPSKEQHCIQWHSYDSSMNKWYFAEIQLPHFFVTQTNSNDVSIQLFRFLKNAQVLNPDFLQEKGVYVVNNYLEFDKEDGFGSSSTLTNNIALWADVNPFSLHFNAFKGSGFDVAVALNGQPLLYTMNGNQPLVEIVNWQKNFTDKLYFVYLNKKQISRNQLTAIKHPIDKTQIAQISNISKLIAANDDYYEFCLMLELAESETSRLLNRPTIKQELFPDFKGSIKSLGAWGGDYILATGDNTENYFKQKGFHKIYTYQELIKE
jgi:mevalonate kinase